MLNTRETNSYGPALQKMLVAFPDAREKYNGWYEHADNPRFDFRVKENGELAFTSWTGRTEDEILAMRGLKRADISLNGHTYPGPTKDSLDLLDLAIAKNVSYSHHSQAAGARWESMRRLAESLIKASEVSGKPS